MTNILHDLMFNQNIINERILIKVVETNTYHVLSFVKRNNYSYKLRYERYLELIYKCLSNNLYTELTHKIIQYGEITYVYGKTHVTVVYVILRLEITKLSYIENVML